MSHFVKPGAKRLKTSGSFENLLAFVNPDGSIIAVIHNDQKTGRQITVNFGEKSFVANLEPESFSTFSVAAISK